MYKNLVKNENAIRDINSLEFVCNYNDGAYLEIKSSKKEIFKVEFMN